MDETHHTIIPEDFISNFKSVKKPELYEQICHEGEVKKKYIIFHDFLRKIYLKYIANPNDLELEKVWSKGIHTPRQIVSYLEGRFADDHLRKFEYAFEALSLLHKDVKKGIIVDMGGGFSYSTITPALFRFPDSQIISVDVIDFPRKSKYGIKYITGNCMDTNLPSGDADVVSMISMLEHVGLGRYGDPLDIDGDMKAMLEARRILKPGGHLILTIPYGYPTVVYNLHRIYDEGRFRWITKGFTPVVLEYTCLGKKCEQKDIVDKHATTLIPGYYEDSVNKNYNAQGGIMALLQKI